jgi:hypothetical protein
VHTALLFKQDLIDAEFIKAENQRSFAKLDAVQDAGLLRSSFQVPIEEAELRVPHKQDVSNQPISLGDKNDHGLICPRSFANE